MAKSKAGHYFEDFALHQVFDHPVPRTLTQGDAALYMALYGGRHPVISSDEAARRLGFQAAPIDEFLVFHIVFGRSVGDISLNAVANLGYAELHFLKPVFAGDTLQARSTVIGLKETSAGDTGIVYVRTAGTNQRGESVLEFARWVMVRKRERNAMAPTASIPALNAVVPASQLVVPERLDAAAYDPVWTASKDFYEDYAAGERIDHLDGMTLEEAEHQMATRLYQNTAKVHFNQYSEGQGRFGRRLVYGGHVISLARALSFNGLANAFHVAAINGGRHVAPLFAGDTVFAWSEILEKAELPGRADVGALRVRLVAAKNRPCADFPYREGEGFEPSVVLDFDFWALIPR